MEKEVEEMNIVDEIIKSLKEPPKGKTLLQKRITILNTEYRIFITEKDVMNSEKDDATAEGKITLGTHNIHGKKIELNKLLCNHELITNRDPLNNVFTHEVLHSVIHNSFLKRVISKKHEENVVEILTSALHVLGFTSYLGNKYLKEVEVNNATSHVA